MVLEPSKLIETLRGATERECEAAINQLIRDVQRETAEECIKIGHEIVENWGKVTMHHLEHAIQEQFGLKEKP